jgi:hypothetical protein
MYCPVGPWHTGEANGRTPNAEGKRANQIWQALERGHEVYRLTYSWASATKKAFYAFLERPHSKVWMASFLY